MASAHCRSETCCIKTSAGVQRRRLRVLDPICNGATQPSPHSLRRLLKPLELFDLVVVLTVNNPTHNANRNRRSLLPSALVVLQVPPLDKKLLRAINLPARDDALDLEERLVEIVFAVLKAPLVNVPTLLKVAELLC